jgi:hypothetical protein
LVVSVVLLVMPLAVALMIADLGVATSTVLIVKVLVVTPDGIVMLLTVGEAIVGLVLESATTIPLAGAAHSRITVPVEEAGPTNELGLRDRLCTPMGRTVSVEVFVTVPSVALMVPVCVVVTGTVVMVNVLLVTPAGIVTLAGGRAAARLSEIVTFTPPAGAGAASATVPVMLLQPATVMGLIRSSWRVGVATNLTPAWVMVKVLPATVNVPVREVVLVLADTL